MVIIRDVWRYELTWGGLSVAGALKSDSSVASHLLRDIEGVVEVEETSSPWLFVDTSGLGNGGGGHV